MSRYVDDQNEGMGVFAAGTLIIIGMCLGMVLLMLARSCDRAPMPAVTGIVDRINCQHCHGVRLDNGARYVRYWRERRKFDQKVIVSAKDDSVEDDRLMGLILGTRP